MPSIYSRLEEHFNRSITVVPTTDANSIVLFRDACVSSKNWSEYKHFIYLLGHNYSRTDSTESTYLLNYRGMIVNCVCTKPSSTYFVFCLDQKWRRLIRDNKSVSYPHRQI